MKVVAVDAMGSDAAPGPEVEGALAAVRAGVARVILVGDAPRLRAEILRLGPSSRNLSVRQASEVISMQDHPGWAARRKRDSSMRVAFDLVRAGEAHAVVSAGNSGAMMACGTLTWKRCRGVERPGIVTTFPTVTGVCALIDMGANVDCRPEMLAQFAVLGSIYARMLHDKPRPRVGLLSNGTEPQKGTELTRAALALLERSGERDFEFVGYVEGRDIFNGACDVVVTDGFTGNVVLKTAEGAALVMGRLLKEVLTSSTRAKVGALLAKDSFAALRRRIDYEEAGGAPLLGLDRIAIVCHGSASPRAIERAIGVAAQFHDAGLPQAIAEGIASHRWMWAEPAGGRAAELSEDDEGSP